MADQSPRESPPREIGGAHVSVRIGKTVDFNAHITTRGLLAVGVLVSGILLGSATIVLAAKRSGGHWVPRRVERGS